MSQRSASPSKFESQATSSPSKLSVPNRKQRNQPSNRVHDIEFATEISTSLLTQVRNLQALLAEKDDALRTVTLEKSRLEIEAEGFNQRLRALDDSEHRYKDENWNLELKIHEFLAAQKESASREQKLTQSLNIAQAEKGAAQKELDEIKLSHAKLSEDHVAALKHHEAELGSAKRTMTKTESERGALQRKIEELTGQNQELARAVANQRGRLEDRDQQRRLSDEDFETAEDNATPEHSPPPSPIKGTPRHSMLESETLKSSLNHSLKMIQNLKGTLHREKTERLQLTRLLQEARDEIDARRSEIGSANGRRNRKAESIAFKKPLRPAQLGGPRRSRDELFIEDPNWEEDDGQGSPTRSSAIAIARAPGTPSAIGILPSSLTDASDHFETANEIETDVFETANERTGTETEDFQTGVEEMSGSDDLTETETNLGPAGRLRQKPPPLPLLQPGNRESFQSTASLSGDEYSYEEVKTPTASQPQRLRLKVNRGQNRRSRQVSEEPEFRSSPPSFASSSRGGTPQQQGQSLFAELGDFDGSDEEDSMMGTPSRQSAHTSQVATPSSRPGSARYAPFSPSPPPPVPRLPMVDSSMMTEPWEPKPLTESEPTTPRTAVPLLAGGLVGAGFAEAAHILDDKRVSVGAQGGSHILDVGSSTGAQANVPTDSRVSTGAQASVDMSDAGSQFIDSRVSTSSQAGVQMSDAGVQFFDNRVSAGSQAGVEMSDAGSQYFDDNRVSTGSQAGVHMSDSASQWHDEQTDGFLKVESDRSRPISTSTYSDMSSQYDPHLIEDSLAKFPSPPTSQTEKPIANLDVAEAIATPLTFSSIVSENFEPSQPEPPAVPGVIVREEPTAPLVISSIHSVDTEPIEPRSPGKDVVAIPKAASDEDTKPEPEAPKNTFAGSIFGWGKGKRPATPIIAEDDTRQSVSDSPLVDTPNSQRPFGEISSNPHDHSPKKIKIEMNDGSSQTALTAEQIDDMLKSKQQKAAAQEGQKTTSLRGVITPSALKNSRSQENIDSTGPPRSMSPEFVLAPDPSTIKRPGSATSARNNSMTSRPPLPTDHKQVIAAAAQRSGSSSGTPMSGPGSMGPPLMSASAYRAANPTLSPSIRSGTIPRPMHSSGTAELHSPTRTRASRASSVTSFASEVDVRFGLRPGMMPNGMQPTTDPRMINAITQTMIGEYLWKYTRKTGRGAMSGNRHRRYFWVHPYTRTLYWSDNDPSSANRAEVKAKSVPIEAVRVVTDDNPMPPGLHRKSLVIVTPGRSIKFTAATGQRHETWFNALSYLLLRTGDEATGDTSELASGALTQEDVDEFNPGYSNNTTRRGPPSLSSYNSRTTRNESPSRSNPRLTPTPQLSSVSPRPSIGTFSRISSYLKPGKEGQGSTYGSKRSRHSLSNTNPDSIYEASEVHDSAEDLREIIEKQDRESDRLENVRACCDGKFIFCPLYDGTLTGNR